VASVLPEGCGVRITIEVPRGEEVAEKTFNPNLGIVGGISILGTTGIVEPMSEKAYRESLALELKQAVAEGHDQIVLVFGNYGRDMADRLGFSSDEVVRMSNFVGYMLNQSKLIEVKKIIILGHIGKLVKVAGGIFNTHSKVADARKEIIAAYTAAIGAEADIIKEILESNTSTEAVQIIQKAGLDEVFDILAERVAIRIRDYLKSDQIDIKSIIFTLEEGVLGSYG
jgi:cobalt-precorrin-5B (C1)-methyltransferase